jgi:hypothetical protein
MLDLSFVLKALGYGAMGVTAIVLCLSYLLVRQLAGATPPRAANDGTLLLVQKYMRFALICTGAMVALQVADQVVKVYADKKLQDLEGRALGGKNFDAVSEWHWHWGEGGWETKGKFIRSKEGAYKFSATTMYRGCGGNEPIMQWDSTAPITITDDGSDIVFLGTRSVVATDSSRAQLNLGPRKVYPTRFVFKRSWALSGSYSGPDGGGPFGDIMFYAPRK